MSICKHIDKLRGSTRESSFSLILCCLQCSGTYELTLQPKTVRDYIDTLEGVASFYGFTWLQEELCTVVPREEQEPEAMETEITAE